MRQLFNVPDGKQVRMWINYQSNTYEHLSKLDNEVQNAGLYHGQVIVIEPQNDDGTWPRQSNRGSVYSESYTFELYNINEII